MRSHLVSVQATGGRSLDGPTIGGHEPTCRRGGEDPPGRQVPQVLIEVELLDQLGRLLIVPAASDEALKHLDVGGAQNMPAPVDDLDVAPSLSAISLA